MSTQSSDEKLIAVLQSAKAPTDKQRSRLLAFLKRTYGQEPELTWQQDDSLEKGFRLKAGSDVYDWSLEGRMRQFQERMQQLEPGQENIVPLMRQAIENWTPAAQAEEVGQVLTVGEVAAIAARMNEAITGDSIYLVDSILPWYTSYVDYLEKLGVEVPDPVKQATRQEFIAMLAAVVPEDMLTPINQITALPDTADAAVLSFYNAGILTGVDDWGTFAPGKTLTRAETAAMVARVARPELRESFTPADYAMFTAAYLKPADVLFTNGVTAGQYLPYVQTLIDGLEADCAAQGMEFNWFNTVDGVTFLDYVEDTALAHFGVTAKDGTQLYKDFDMQVYYSRYLDQKG